MKKHHTALSIRTMHTHETKTKRKKTQNTSKRTKTHQEGIHTKNQDITKSRENKGNINNHNKDQHTQKKTIKYETHQEHASPSEQ